MEFSSSAWRKRTTDFQDTNQASEYTCSMPGGQEAEPPPFLLRALLPIHKVGDLTFALLLLWSSDTRVTLKGSAELPAAVLGSTPSFHRALNLASSPPFDFGNRDSVVRTLRNVSSLLMAIFLKALSVAQGFTKPLK